MSSVRNPDTIVDGQTAETIQCFDVAWELERHGEVVLWGKGAIDFDFNKAGEGYCLYVEDLPPDTDFNDYACKLIRRPDDESCGLVWGEYYHKMTKDASPDVRVTEY